VFRAPLILGSAHRHGVSDDDIRHVLREYVHLFDVGDGTTMVIGPDPTGGLVEVGVVESYDTLCMVHALRPARQKFLWR
jgi:hypothetical protein